MITYSSGFIYYCFICIGIPFLSPAQEEKIREILANKHKLEREALSKNDSGKSNGQKPIDVPKEEEQFVANVQ